MQIQIFVSSEIPIYFTWGEKILKFKFSIANENLKENLPKSATVLWGWMTAAAATGQK